MKLAAPQREQALDQPNTLRLTQTSRLADLAVFLSTERGHLMMAWTNQIRSVGRAPPQTRDERWMGGRKEPETGWVRVGVLDESCGEPCSGLLRKMDGWLVH